MVLPKRIIIYIQSHIIRGTTIFKLKIVEDINICHLRRQNKINLISIYKKCKIKRNNNNQYKSLFPTKSNRIHYSMESINLIITTLTKLPPIKSILLIVRTIIQIININSKIISQGRVTW